MAITAEEKKLVRAYNIGATLALHEPKLLSAIIKSNPKNEFVKTMELAKDHGEFRQNIPRKDFTPGYKNGYINSQTLYRHNPQLLDRMIGSKNSDKDFIQGLQDGKQEMEIKSLQRKAKNEPKQPDAEYKADFTKGFNHGYTLSDNNWFPLKNVIESEKRWGAYVEGLKAGEQQYMKDGAKQIERHKNVPKQQSKDISDADYDTRILAENLNELSEAKSEKLDGKDLDKLNRDIIHPVEPVKEPEPENPDTLLNYLPSWLQKDRFIKDDNDIEPHQDDIDRDFDPER